MRELLVWFMFGQTLAGLPQMLPGTEVMLVSPDLLTIHGRATVSGGRLVFSGPLEPGEELRVVIFPPDASAEETAQALTPAQALPGRVSEDGSDVEIRLEDQSRPLSLRRWLLEERGIVLEFRRAAPGGSR